MTHKIKKIAVLGSTGSIGINTLKVVKSLGSGYQVEALSAFNNLDLFIRQVKEFRPKHVAIAVTKIPELKRELVGLKTSVHAVEEGLKEIVTSRDVDLVVIAVTGRAALEPFLYAAQAGKTIAPANKEALVIAGELLMQAAEKNRAVIVPVDSEQSAIFQCLTDHNRGDLKRVYLTASGGALHKVAKKRFSSLTQEDILRHPRWKMGRKITVDSATLMNKGFEIIEAQRLFRLTAKEIEVVIHPQAIIHSMVCFKDGSVLAQLGITDMRLPIQYALTYPKRVESGLADLDITKCGPLTFAKPDLKKFPCLNLAMDAAHEGGSLPVVLNAADEVVVQAFLDDKIKFIDIYNLVRGTFDQHKKIDRPSLDEILAADEWARRYTEEKIQKIGKKRILCSMS
jgi:1-deoxy-D-xylulose-5-phosphate reductoisomerase